LLGFPPFLSLWFFSSSFNIYLIEYWALVFLFSFYWISHWFWKWYEVSYSSTLSCLIIKLHSFIQFAFDEVAQYHNQVTDFVCWLGGIEAGFFQNFFEIIFCLNSSFNILFTRNWALTAFTFLFKFFFIIR
jgi:hypothetical protein